MKSLILAAALLLPPAAFGQNPASPPSITVNGQAEIMVVPDQVVFSLNVENENLDLNAAKRATDEGVKKVFELARKNQIPPQNVQTYYISVSKQYDRVENKPLTFRGYKVGQTIVILLPEISRFESLFSDVLTMGITEVNGVEFRVSNTRKYMDQARAQALKAAREKAVDMARELGQRVGKTHSITEVDTDLTSAYESERQSYSANYSTSAGNTVSDNKGSVAPGMMSVSARVKVVFELY